MPIPVACQCGQKFQAKDQLAGKKVKCPKCSNPLRIPSPQQAAPPAPMPAPSTASGPTEIPIACACGQQMKAKAKLFGKKVKCPKCGQPIQIPNPAQQPAPAVPPQPAAPNPVVPAAADPLAMPAAPLGAPIDAFGAAADPLAAIADPMAAPAPLPSSPDPLGGMAPLPGMRDPLAAAANPMPAADPLGGFDQANAFDAGVQPLAPVGQPGFPDQPHQPMMEQPMMGAPSAGVSDPNPAFQGFGAPGAMPQKKKGMSKGMVIGLASGGGLLLLLILGLIYWLFMGGDSEVVDGGGGSGATASAPNAPPPFDPLSLVAPTDYVIARVDTAAMMETPAFKGFTPEMIKRLSPPQTMGFENVVEAQPDQFDKAWFIGGVGDQNAETPTPKFVMFTKFKSAQARDQFYDSVMNPKGLDQLKQQGIQFDIPKPEVITFNDAQYAKMPPSFGMYKMDTDRLLMANESIVQSVISGEKGSVNQSLIDKFKAHDGKGQIAAVFDITAVRDQLTTAFSGGQPDFDNGQPGAPNPDGPGNDPVGGAPGGSPDGQSMFGNLKDLPNKINGGEVVIDFAGATLLHFKLQTTEEDSANNINSLVQMGKGFGSMGINSARTQAQDQPFKEAVLPLIDLASKIVNGMNSNVEGTDLVLQIAKPAELDNLAQMLSKMADVKEQMEADALQN